MVLHNELARNPNFFAEIVAMLYRAEGEEPREPTKEEQAPAHLAFDLLHSWRRAPGTAPDGTLDAGTLNHWMRRAREALVASGRGAIGDQVIGQVLSGAPLGTDGIWPHEAVRDVVEEIASAELERGLEIGLYNSRGVVTKAPGEGGAQERQLAKQYEAFAAAAADRWQRTAAMLRRIAADYRRDAQREDQEAELRDVSG